MKFDLGLSILALSGHFVATTVLLRTVLRFSPVMLHVASSLAFMVAFVLMGLGLVPGLAPRFNVWPGLSLLAFGSMVFLFAYSGIYKSISLRFLVELADRHPGGLDVEELYERILRDRFVDRLELLRAGGLLTVGEGRYAASAKGLAMNRTFDRLKEMLGFGKSGLYFSKSQK